MRRTCIYCGAVTAADTAVRCPRCCRPLPTLEEAKAAIAAGEVDAAAANGQESGAVAGACPGADGLPTAPKPMAPAPAAPQAGPRAARGTQAAEGRATGRGNASARAGRAGGMPPMEDDKAVLRRRLARGLALCALVVVVFVAVLFAVTQLTGTDAATQVTQAQQGAASAQDLPKTAVTSQTDPA